MHGRPPERVLDVGGGPGATAESVRRRWPDAQVTVLDVDPALLALADAALPQGAYRAGRHRFVTLVPLAGGPYDLVLTLMTVHYLPEDRVRDWYAEARQLLRPDGLLLVGEVMPKAPAPAQPQSGTDPWTTWWTSLAGEPAVAPLLGERAEALAGLTCAEFVASVDWHRETARQAGFGEATVLHQRAGHALIALHRPADRR